jgi:hypothetical protein
VTKLTTLLLGVSLTLLPRAGCAVGPNYIFAGSRTHSYSLMLKRMSL